MISRAWWPPEAQTFKKLECRMHQRGSQIDCLGQGANCEALLLHRISTHSRSMECRKLYCRPRIGVLSVKLQSQIGPRRTLMRWTCRRWRRGRVTFLRGGGRGGVRGKSWKSEQNHTCSFLSDLAVLQLRKNIPRHLCSFLLAWSRPFLLQFGVRNNMTP